MNQLMTKNIIPPRTPIAVVRLDTLEHVVPMTRALARGGITRVEMTLTSERALEAVSQVQRELQGEVVIGMGTVLDGEGAHVGEAAYKRGVRQKYQEVIVWTAQKLECPPLAGA